MQIGGIPLEDGQGVVLFEVDDDDVLGPQPVSDEEKTARYERGHRLPSLDVVEAYETELGVVARSLVALHERAGLEVYGLRI